MKYLLIGLFLVSILLSAAEARVYDKRNTIDSVTVTTMTAVSGGGRRPGRCYYKVENISQSYEVKRATWPLGCNDTGDFVYSNGGSWVDEYEVYQSTWFYIIHGDGPANVAPYEATIRIHQKD